MPDHTMLAPVSLTLFLSACFGILVIYVLYPLYLLVRPAFRREIPRPRSQGVQPKISVIVVTHNGAPLVEEKIQNCLALDYPRDRLEFFFCSDGSTDGTAEMIGRFVSRRLHLVSYSRQRGKASIINDVVKHSRADLLLFSDIDAMLEPGCLRLLVPHFEDAGVGGVSGARVIGGVERGPLLEPQQRYIFADGVIKKLESQTGSTTSNDGKLYVIRRRLFRPIHPEATDDLFTCLNVVEQGKRFIYEPNARAMIPRPSIDLGHEIRRRRRIVCRSLVGIWVMRAMLNPIRLGAFAVGLFINKVLRRAQPFFLVTIFFSSLVLAFDDVVFWPVFAAQAILYLFAALQIPIYSADLHLPRNLERSVGMVAYFCVGNLGTLMGVIDFLRGIRYTTWTPLKTNRGK
jgi:cellulose synthase/poly-beta-1,6-N-acetylglucosamine synthase-like glycosyltransferase